MTQEAILFDTHRFVQNLVASGFTEKQAEALAYEQIRLLNNNMATKSDIEALRLATKPDMKPCGYPPMQRLKAQSSKC